jgi:hypothetical protein
MTLFSAPHATKVLVLAVALATGGMMSADARDEQPGTGWSDSDISGRVITRRERHERRDWRPRNRHRYDDRRTERRREQRQWSGGNFYGGAISAYRDPGNGTYFYIDNDGYDGDAIDAPFVENRRPKVIVVTPGQDGCSWEAGVCVIRPGS